MTNHTAEPTCKKCYGTGRYGTNGSEVCPDCHTNHTAGWEASIREEVAGSMTSVEAVNHLIEVIRHEIATARAEAVDFLVENIYGESFVPNADFAKVLEEARASAEKGDNEQEV